MPHAKAAPTIHPCSGTPKETVKDVNKHSRCLSQDAMGYQDLSSNDSSIWVGKIEDVHHLLVSRFAISRLAAVI